MNTITKDLLRNAIKEALTGKHDAAAMELLSLLTDSPTLPAQPTTTLALAPAKEVIPGNARDYHYWTSFIRENFIPFMTANGRLRFTSHELMTWLENNPANILTTGDIEQHASGREVWRSTVSAALSTLKHRGIVKAPVGGRDYEINRPALMPEMIAT